MNDTLDSRALRFTDCYGQRFMRPGTYRYAILPVHGHWMSDERPFTVLAVEPAAQPEKLTQHQVSVRWSDGRFAADPAEIRIEVGDLVMWNCASSKAPPFAVVGDQDFFSSHRLRNESGYSHAFGSPGEYRWRDAYGSDIGGVVSVVSPEIRTPEDLGRWRRGLSKGTLVLVADGSAEPAEVHIVTGQTVFFAVTKTSGITITDERLLTLTPAPGEKARD
jgi:plastocyanin